MPNQDKKRDHFVARAYLRRFAGKSGNLNVYDRINQKYIKPKPEAICCEVGWDILENAMDKYILRSLLQEIEPNLDKAINSIVSEELFIEDRIVLSWYLGVLLLLNPDYLESAKEMHENIAKSSADVLIDSGVIDMPPEIEKVLGGKHNFKAEVNPDYVKSFIASLLPRTVFSLYKSPWFIIKNNSEEEFITSDKPFYFMCCPHSLGIYPKYIALDTKHILLIPPPLSVNEKADANEIIDFNAENVGRIFFRDVDCLGVNLFNIYTVTNANRFVIAHNISKELDTTILKNIKYRTKAVNSKLPMENGELIVTTMHCDRSVSNKNKDFEQLMKIILPERF